MGRPFDDALDTGEPVDIGLDDPGNRVSKHGQERLRQVQRTEHESRAGEALHRGPDGLDR